MAVLIRKRRTLHLPITLSVILMGLNIALMVCWIIFLSKAYRYTAVTVGIVLFSLVLVGLTIYLVLSIKSVRLHWRQVNFVDSVTHELKSPIAAVRLYLDTLKMRETLSPEQRSEFYDVMEGELNRLEGLIDQLLEVGRLERIGQESDPEDVEVLPLLQRCAKIAAAHQKVNEDVFTFDAVPAVVHARPVVLEMMFGNLLENGIKYGGSPPHVDVQVRVRNRNRVFVRVADNGPGVPPDQRTKIFDLFYRGGNELERTRKGTGLGLYIVRTLVHFLKGRVAVYDRYREKGSVFEVELPAAQEENRLWPHAF